MKRLTLTSTYRKSKTIVRLTATTDRKDRQCLRISAAAFRAAEARCSYAGTDGISIHSIPVLEGYGPWSQDHDGNVIAIATA